MASCRHVEQGAPLSYNRCSMTPSPPPHRPPAHTNNTHAHTQSHTHTHSIFEFLILSPSPLLLLSCSPALLLSCSPLLMFSCSLLSDPAGRPIAANDNARLLHLPTISSFRLPSGWCSAYAPAYRPQSCGEATRIDVRAEPAHRPVGVLESKSQCVYAARHGKCQCGGSRRNS